ncbi:helix-turn-helix transcriptional regulator [Herbaspirillum sp. 1173]|uniref:helix-turn-helix domain-containing protein n=1 Tax=Herbaspirillum sp. 1173 TaxID=2817734 RepID=UPI00286B5DB5|nr:helix-turn-helix transcriptional regulator [Herbaspirillum sp. 1173]
MSSRKDNSGVFPRRLKSARQAAGLTQFGLGVSAGIDEYSASPRINQYERGVHIPDQGTSLRLAKALNVPLSYLFEPNEQLAEFILLAARLTKDDLKKLTSYLREALGERGDLQSD